MLRQVSAMDFNLMEADNMEGHQVSIGTLAGGHILRDIKSRKCLMRKEACVINQEASRGIEFPVDAGLVPDPNTPSVVAAFFAQKALWRVSTRGPQKLSWRSGKSPSSGQVATQLRT